MKMSKNYKKICLALGLTGILGAGAVTAQSGTKNLSATYRNIRVTYNGVTQSIANEPFLVEGSTYVPLRAIGDIFGADARWDPATNTVILTGGSTSSSTSEAELAQLKYQVTTLTKQLSDANAELAQYKSNSNGSSNGSTTTSGSTITQAQLNDTEKYLNDNFYDALHKDISLGYTLTLTGNQLNVAITYNSKSENRTFDKNVSESNVEKFLKRIGDNIAATHSDIIISGTLEYTGDSEEKASFERAKNGSYRYTHSFDEDKLKEIIEDETSGYFYFDYITPSSLTISDLDIKIRPLKSSASVKLYLAQDSNFEKSWGNADKEVANRKDMTPSERKSAVQDQLEVLMEELISATNGYDVTVEVYYTKDHFIASIDSDERIKTDTFTYYVK